MEQKNKFGSTPLFNIPPAPPVSNTSSATTRPNGKFAGPTSYSCHEVKNGYAIPNGMPNNNCSTFNTENFYAATDIVLKVIYEFVTLQNFLQYFFSIFYEIYL